MQEAWMSQQPILWYHVDAKIVVYWTITSFQMTAANATAILVEKNTQSAVFSSRLSDCGKITTGYGGGRERARHLST